MLVLRDNLLEDLPQDIPKLQALSHLNLQGNQFKTVPLCLGIFCQSVRPFKLFTGNTKLDSPYCKLLLAGNPLEKYIKELLKDGGVKRLFVSLRDPVAWQKLVESSTK